jgi:GAF domain-containing protein
VGLGVALVLAVLAYLVKPVRSWLTRWLLAFRESRQARKIAPGLIEELLPFMIHLRDVTKAFRGIDGRPEAVRERVRREILEPIRGYIPTLPGEQMKIVWFRPHADGVHLHMYEQVGHTEEGQAALRLRIGGSLAGKAFSDKETVYRPRCEDDPLFQPVEQSKATGSIACIPITRGGGATGVLSVLSTCEHAFWLGVITYLEALAAAIGSLEAHEGGDVPDVAKGDPR